jgi:hypothetical protein
VAPRTLARAFAAELASGATEFHTLVGNFIICAILGKKPAFGDAIKSEQVRMTAAIFYTKTKMGWKETVVNEQANKDDKPFPVDDARQRLISPDPERPLYEPSKRRLTWPNGAVATTYSADEAKPRR